MSGSSTVHLQPVGSSAGASGLRGLGIWRYRTATGPTPAAGQLQFDNAVIDSATNLYINVLNDGGTDMSNFLALIEANDLVYIQVQADASQFVVVEVDTSSLAAGVYTFPILNVEGQGAAPNNNAQVAVVTTAAGGAATTLQAAYDAATTPPQIVINATPDPLALMATVAGPVLQVQDTLGANIFEVDDTFVEVDGNLRVVDAFINHAAANSIDILDTFTTGGNFIGGAMAHSGTITYTASLSIFTTFSELVTYVAAVAPGFAAYTMMQGLPVFSSGLGFDQVQCIGINMAPRRQRVTAGTSVVATATGFNFSPLTAATVAGATQDNGTQIGMIVRPTFSTVAGSTADLGPITGVLMRNPAVGLFQPGAGTELMTSYIGLDVEAIPFGGNVLKAAVRSSILSASNAYFLQNLGTAHSDFGSSHIYFDDNFGVVWGGNGTANFDAWYSWNSAGYLRKFFLTNSDEYRTSNPVNNQILHDYVANEITWNTTRGFSIGAQTGTLGNQFGNFVAGARTTQIAGEWSDFLLTQAANITVDDAMGLVAGWTINAPSITLGTGTVTTAGALNVGGNVNQGSVNRFGVRILSNPSGGSGVNAGLWVTAGLSRFDGRVDINQPIALGGGAVATLGTIGATGPTAAAQAQWVEIDINGVAHWIPAWT